MHRLLKRQLKHTYGKNFDINTLDEKVLDLLARINDKYHEVDTEKRFLEHTISINSEELTEAYETIEKHNQSLKEEVDEKETLLQQYKNAIDSMLIVSKMDTNNFTTYVNAQFCELSQYNPEELLFKEDILLHPNYLDSALYAQMNAKLKNKEPWKGKIETKNRSEKPFHLDVAVFPLVNTQDEVLEYMVIAHDISEIERARELAVNSQEAKTQFMANMSHEIRTPMNGIIGFTELLKKGNLDAKQKQYIKLTENSMQTLLRITNDILDFSKIEAGHLQLDLTEVNPFVDFRNALDIFSSKCREKHISFQIRIDAHISECIVLDKLRVTQVLNNLINNAIKFTPEQGVISVEMTRLSSTKNKEKILFSVTDTGIGIPKSRQDKIFQSFIQADSSTTRKFGGTGLGLSISSSLCTLMDSTLQVESIEGKGSKFFFELDVSICEPNATLALQIKNPPIYVIKEAVPIYDRIIHQLVNFGVDFEPISLENFKKLANTDHIVIIFHHNLYEEISLFSQHIILIDESIEAFNLDEKEPSLYHIGFFEECPSILYNAILDHSFTHNNIALTKNNFPTTQFSLSVLVAEDYEINRILIHEMLQEYGITPDFAFNGIEAVKKASRNKYDIIFMDINMPELNGIEATKMIREQHNFTPIVALTANALEGDKEYYLSEGMDNYISKPIDIEALHAILTLYTDKKIKVLEKDDTSSPQDSPTDKTVDALLKAKEKMHFSVDIMKKLFISFIDSSYASIDELIQAIETHDIQTIKMKAHAIRGGALSLELHTIGELCNTLEYDADADYPSLGERLKVEIVQLYETKEAILDTLSQR